jgi:hypothetical protein
MKGVLVGGSGDDGVDFSAECQLGGGFDRVACNAAGANHPGSIGGGVAAPESPGAYGDPVLRRYGGDLVFGSHEGDLRVERLRQSTSGDLRADPAGIAQCDGDSRT